MRNLPRWLREKPEDPNDTRQFNNRTWYYCQKCRRGTGAWNVTHNTDGHIFNYRPQRPHSPNRFKAHLGLRRTSSMDSQDSQHSRTRSNVTFDDDPTSNRDRKHSA